MAAPAPIYLDYQATTPLLPEALDTMMPYLTDRFGNPHSASHRYGWQAEAGVDIAREQLAAALGCPEDDVVFTSGATEANNTALKGLWWGRQARRTRIISLVTEHSCVLNSLKFLESQGADITLLPVQPDGLLDPGVLDSAMGDDVLAVSVMTVNNEIGVIQDLPKIADIVHAGGAMVHSDAAQALGKIDLKPVMAACDLISVSGHKCYGPKGVGALIGTQQARRHLVPLMDGGGQESGIRSGTLAPALVAGFGKAVDITTADMAQEAGRIESLRDHFLKSLKSRIEGLSINGSLEQRWVGNLNLRLPIRDAGQLMSDMPDLAVSSGSACASDDPTVSHVLTALGLGRAGASTSLRIGIGRDTELSQIDRAADILIDAVQQQRA